MNMQLAAFGRWISFCIVLGLYFSGWTIADGNVSKLTYFSCWMMLMFILVGNNRKDD